MNLANVLPIFFGIVIGLVWAYLTPSHTPLKNYPSAIQMHGEK